MKTLMSMLLVLVVLTLAGCGQRVIVKHDKKEPKGANTPAPVTQTPATQPTQPTAESPAAKAPCPSQPASSPAAEKPASTAPAPITASAEFPPDTVGGKSIDTWFLLLNSKNKEEVKEACGALGIARSKAAGALPKLQELAKSTDKEIADEAVDAIKKISDK